MRDKPNTAAPACHGLALVKQHVPFDAFNCEAYKQWLQPILITDFYRSLFMDKQLENLKEVADDHIERILGLVRDYGLEMRVNGTGAEVVAKYQAIKEALQKGGAA